MKSGAALAAVWRGGGQGGSTEPAVGPDAASGSMTRHWAGESAASASHSEAQSYDI